MTKWLTRQESVHRQDAYLNWCLHSNILQAIAETEDVEEGIRVLDVEEGKVEDRVTMGMLLRLFCQQDTISTSRQYSSLARAIHGIQLSPGSEYIPFTTRSRFSTCKSLRYF
jgi:hypothetical protein